MVKKAARTAPFLIKLQTICSTIPCEIAHWSQDGKRFEVTDQDKFFVFLKGFYEGTTKTFFRQLSYFRFVKSEILPSGFAFSHEHFLKDDISSLSSIKRSIGTNSSNINRTSNALPSSTEFDEFERYSKMDETITNLQNQLNELTKTVGFIVGELKRYRSMDIEASHSRKRSQQYFDLEGDELTFGFEDFELTSHASLLEYSGQPVSVPPQFVSNKCPPWMDGTKAPHVTHSMEGTMFPPLKGNCKRHNK